MDSLSDIAVFVEVVNAGSFTAAAERLSLSKSVVSKYVTRLETRLGVRLLNRTTRHLSPTEAGREFYERSQRGLLEIEEAENAVTRLQAEPRGTLRINVPMSFGVMHIASLIPEFLDKFPELKVDLNLDDRKVDVIKEGYDVSVRISYLPDSSLIARRIGPCRHAIVASPEYLERHGTPRTPGDLKEHNVITYQYQASALEWQFQAEGETPISVPVSGSISMNNGLALRQALLSGAGITRTPTFIVGRDIQKGKLRAVLTGYETLEVSIYVVFPERKLLAPKVRAFVEFLGERISENPYWDG